MVCRIPKSTVRLEVESMSPSSIGSSLKLNNTMSDITIVDAPVPICVPLSSLLVASVSASTPGSKVPVPLITGVPSPVEEIIPGSRPLFSLTKYSPGYKVSNK